MTKQQLTLVLASALMFTACAAPAPSNSNVAANANMAQNQAAVNSAAPVNSAAVNSSTAVADSPTGTVKALTEAAQKKDTATMKKYMTAGTLELLEQQAKEKKMTLDAYLLQDGEEGFVHMPETRNEKITGDKATLEIKDKDTKDDKWMSFPFVKQDGVWKMAFEEYMKELPQRLKEEIEKQTNTSTNKSKAEPKE